MSMSNSHWLIWFKRFHEMVMELEMKKNNHNHNVHYKLLDLHYIFLLVWMDDIVITSNKNVGISKLFLQIKFKIKDLGTL